MSSINLSVFSQKADKIENLFNELQIAKEDTGKISALNKIAEYYSRTEPDSAFKYCDQALKLSEMLNFDKGKAFAFLKKANSFSQKRNLVKAFEFFQKSLDIFIKINNHNEITDCYEGIAKIHYMQGNFELAIQYMKKSLLILEKNGNSKKISKAYSNIGAIYQNQQLFDTALIYYNKSVKIDIESQDSIALSKRYNNIATVYLDQKKFSLSDNYLRKTLEINLKFNDTSGIATSYANLTILHILIAESENSEVKKSTHYNIAVNYAEESLKLTKKIKDINIERYTYYYLAVAYKGLKNYEKALANSNLYIELNDSIYNIDKAKEIEKLQAKYESEKINKENELLKKQESLINKELENEKIIKYFLFIILILLLIFAVFMLLNKRKLNIYYKKEQILNKKIEAKNIVIKENRDEILQSIRYAKSIQTSLLPDKNNVNEILGKNFILYKPKDLVSGDFYFVNKIEEEIFFSVADCTGHGVPGGFLTMLGINSLHEIIRDREAKNPGEVLNYLRKRIHDIFKVSGKSNINGIDMAFCSVNKKTNILQYAGAFNPLWLIREHELIEIKATKNPIGFHPVETDFKNHSIQLKNNDKIYLFSDGYKDQIGGDKSKKLNTKRFKKLLSEISQFPINNQKNILLKELTKWQGENEQIDDITIMGIEWVI
ncbi:MAG: tetratricopeptide repeat protein [Bacteroidales bacterium]|nr:tetratricopeptide repeat protein [Bacteroidales bacterium]